MVTETEVEICKECNMEIEKDVHDIPGAGGDCCGCCPCWTRYGEEGYDE